MQRSTLFAALLFVALGSIASAGGVGEVRVPFDPAVGWASVNTTGNNKLVITAHLDAGLPNEQFDVSIRVRYEDGTNEIFQNLAVLATNAQGKGNTLVQLQTNPPDGDTTLRRVAVRVRRAPQPLYLAVVWDLSLKKARPRS